MSVSHSEADQPGGPLLHGQPHEPPFAFVARRGPREIGSYDILRELGCGGQAVVYKACHKRTNAVVALKVLSLGLAFSDKARHQFDREIDLVAHLDHPYIVKVHDKGTFEHGCYFAMDYVQGKPLDEYLAANELPFRKKMELFREVCDGMAHAHQRGVMHRDLKPSNILVDERGSPHILDFGYAKAAGTLGPGAAGAVSVSCEIKGTPTYLSPEQAEGRPDRVDVRTDIYTLGVVFYQVLTGRFPYDVSGGLSAILASVRAAEPIRPRTVCPGFDSDAQTILLKCLEKDPDHRYHSAAELRDEIDRWLKGLPIHARSGIVYYLRKHIRRRGVPGKLLVGGLLALIVIGFACTCSYLLTRLQILGRHTQAVTNQLGQENLAIQQILDQLAFEDVLDFWQKGQRGTAALCCAGCFPNDQSRERRALAFLQDEEALPEKSGAFRKELGDAEFSFSVLVVAEHYLSSGDRTTAKQLFSEAWDRAQGDKDLILRQRAKRWVWALTELDRGKSK